MRLSILTQCLLSSLFIVPLLQRHVSAVPKAYVVYLGSHRGEPRLLGEPEDVTRKHHEMLSSVSPSSKPSEKLIYSYNKIFNGFAAVLEDDEANELKKHPDVVSIFESVHGHVKTTRSWEFLGFEAKSSKEVYDQESLWEKANFGEDLIVGVIDSGIYPDSKSFADEGFGPAPKKFKGSCENENDKSFHCNRKLIGARYFHKGIEQYFKSKNKSFNETLSPMDTAGHGTHVAGIVAGNFVPIVSDNGLGDGIAKGGAARARLVCYKACWTPPSTEPGAGGNGVGCKDIDLLAAIEAAIVDGVDVINLSVTLPGTRHYFMDVIAIGSFHALMNGISVVAGAGNDGPRPGSLKNVAPWLLTVAASSTDRQFLNNLLLGNKLNIKGASDYYKLTDKFLPLVNGADAGVVGANISAASLCKRGSLDAAKVKGKILTCLLTEVSVSILEKVAAAVEAGAVGMILANNQVLGSTCVSAALDIPTSIISYNDSLTLFTYINSTRSPIVSFGKTITELGVKPTPIMAGFSSRGPNLITPHILKPDVTAPGVEILAAKPGPGVFAYNSGTSMATPHVTAIVGLIKKLHPSWTTAAIRSAIMTTASPLDNMGRTIREESLNVEATPYAYGAGHIRPKLAMDPGLVYDMNHHDYLNFLCAHDEYNKTMIEMFSRQPYKCPASRELWDFNHPSIGIYDYAGNATITRNLKNVGRPSTYTARVNPPPGVSIVVEPKTMTFSALNQVIKYKLTFTSDRKKLPTDYGFGSLVWSDGIHIVRSSIVIMPLGKLVHDFVPKQG